MTPSEISALVTAIANMLAERLSKKELALLIIILCELTSSLKTLIALKDLCGPKPHVLDDVAIG